ncbi:MAG TPA: DNA polymerase III subunit gamma/tau C-terminal domain-containing protein, partial [Gammaproteobacteria bacterium]|nr:DNA polymerase III subunit gamma/tau C-terminal domain-containing protein [Gammaproteobacteria bacterium]
DPAPASTDAATGSSGGTAGGAPASEWEGILGTLEVPPSWRALLEFAVPREFTAERVRLGFPSEQLLSASSERFRTALESALTAYFGQAPGIAIEELGEGTAEESPAASRERRHREAQEAAEQAVADDPNVQVLQEQFGARLDSVRPEGQDPSSN